MNKFQHLKFDNEIEKPRPPIGWDGAVFLVVTLGFLTGFWLGFYGIVRDLF